MKDKNVIRTIISFILGIVFFVRPEILLYIIAAFCVYVIVMTIIETIKDRNRH